jgi:hypothetical protein
MSATSELNVACRLLPESLKAISLHNIYYATLGVDLSGYRQKQPVGKVKAHPSSHGFKSERQDSMSVIGLTALCCQDPKSEKNLRTGPYIPLR